MPGLLRILQPLRCLTLPFDFAKKRGFSLPNRGENHRGYVSYTVAEIQDGWSIDAWINYTHQTPWPQYPVITAKQKEQTMGVSDTHTFKTIQDAIQFFPGDETK